MSETGGLMLSVTLTLLPHVVTLTQPPFRPFPSLVQPPAPSLSPLLLTCVYGKKAHCEQRWQRRQQKKRTKSRRQSPKSRRQSPSYHPSRLVQAPCIS